MKDVKTTSTYKEQVRYQHYINPQHVAWAKEIRWKFPKLLFQLTDEEVAIMYEDWSEDTMAAGWLIEDMLTEKSILDMLARYKVENGAVYRLLNKPIETTVSVHEVKEIKGTGDFKVISF